MSQLAELEDYDRMIEPKRRGLSVPVLSPESLENAKQRFHLVLFGALRPSKIEPTLDQTFEEARTEFEEEQLTRPFLTALTVDVLIRLPTAKQAIIALEQKRKLSFIIWSSLHAGIKSITRGVTNSESLLKADEDFAYLASIRAARTGRAKTIAEQVGLQRKIEESIAQNRKIRDGDPTAEQLIIHRLAGYPQNTPIRKVVVPLALEGALQSQLLYTALFPATARFFPDEMII